jgi:lipopolysaccharide export system permease protein
MRLLDRYLLRELLVPLAYCLVGFMVFWISFDLLSDLDEFQESEFGLGEILLYYLIKAPEFLVTVMPIALLLALLYAITNHARHNEIIAIRGAGISVWRLGIPYLGVGLVCGLAFFAINELWVPDSLERSDEMLHRGRKDAGADGIGRWRRNLNFRHSGADRVWNIAAYHEQTYEMRNPQIDWRLPDGQRRHLFAECGRRTNDAWLFLNVQQWTNQPGSNTIPVISRSDQVLIEDFEETPEMIQSEIKISNLSNIKAARRVQLSLREIMNYQRLHPQLEPRDTAMLRTQFHARLAAPWTCLVVVLVALPVGAITTHRRNVFVGVANSIFICFTYFVLMKVGLALGTGEFTPPWLGAWLPNWFFAALGLYLLFRRV